MDPEHPAPLRRLVHVPALDVLRAFAVTIVVISHIWVLGPSFHFREIFSNAGFLGVDLFFVISGFLITALLLQERHDNGRIGFGRFYLRRALRLLPALFAMLAVYLVYANRTDWPPFGSRDLVLDNVRATLLYVMNWRVLQIGDGAGDLVALWSLAIEEQFYVAWPLILTGLLALRQGTRRMVPILVVAIVAVTVWRMAVYQWWGWEAAYLRTDTRVDGLLLGALVATLFVRGLTPARLPRWTPGAVIAVWCALLLTVKGDGAFAYNGGITLWILASAAMILYLVSDPQPLRSLPARAAEKVGKGSYAIYLWQVPVIRAVSRWDDTDATVRRMATALVGIAICTVVSWYLVERPAQRFRRRLERRRVISGDDPPTADASVAPTG